MILGQVLTAATGQNPARQASINAGLNKETPAWLVNQVCGSGLRSVALAYQSIMNGDANIIIAGGQESMSQSPHCMHLRNGTKMGDDKMIDSMIKDGLWDAFNGYHMGTTAENVAQQWQITRDQQDEFAFNSHKKALNAIDTGLFKEEIVPIEVEEIFLDQNEKKQTRSYTVDTDEGPRRGTNIEALSRLRPVFAAGGSVTAGNASQTSDGAAFVMVMSETMIKELNLEPIAQLLSYHVAGLEPSVMGMGPVYAAPKAIEKAGLKLKDIEQFELNEAFASQSVAVLKELDLNPDIVNVNGGAIALGHPLGCTGAKLSVQLFNEMRRRKQRYGMVTMCVGTGQGAAGVFEFLK